MGESQIIEGAEEFELGEGPVGALLMHGFQGSPQGMRGLGEYLSERGIAVLAPRLPGHGSTWQDLNTRTAEEWLGTFEDGIERLSEGRDEIFLVGLSFGAALCLDYAARHPRKVAGVVSLAGWVYTNDPLRLVAPIASRLIGSLPAKTNDIAEPGQREIATDRLPAKAGYLAYKFACKRARRALPQVTSPILVMAGREDHTIPTRSSQFIFDEVASVDKELVWLDRSYHVITLDYDRQQVFERTHEFIVKHSNAL